MSVSPNNLPRNADPAQLVMACASGDRRAASRLISLLESSNEAQALETSRQVAALPLPNQTIGITGPPGAGKSTLIDFVTGLLRAQNRKVGILAVDPSSPFTGGALLGDRIRMSSHRNDLGVFIRSMGSRGATGGLAEAAGDALRILGGAGYDTVLLETVGAGQTETEVVALADTICVVQVPGLGDDVQLMKMGILEIADIFIVNKADRPGAELLQQQIEDALDQTEGEVCRALRQLGPAFAKIYGGPRYRPPVLPVSALQKQGGAELMEALEAHRTFLAQPELQQALLRVRLGRELRRRAVRYFERRILSLARKGGLDTQLERLIKGETSLDEEARRLLG